MSAGAVTFTERLKGWIAFGETDFNQGWRTGKRLGTACSFVLDVTVPDGIEDDPRHRATCTGKVVCHELGGELAVESSELHLLEEVTGPRDRQFVYRLMVRDREGRPITFEGYKVVQDDRDHDTWHDTATLFVRVHPGHHPGGPPPGAPYVACGILKVGRLDFARQLASFRGPPGALWEFNRFFVGGLLRTYIGPEVGLDSGDFPRLDRFHGFAPGEWHTLPQRPRLERRIVAVQTEDGFELTLHNLRGADAPTRGPVLVNHGSASRAHLYYGGPVSLAERLVDEGYDVWIQNWRGSIDLLPNPWTIEKVAAFDHPACVRKIVAETGATRMSAVVHCMGSATFCLAAAAGLLPEVDNIVASGVSFHVDVKRTARIKQQTMLPLAKLVLDGVDAQWGARRPSTFASLFARHASLVRRRDCDDPTCRVNQYCYGTGPDVVFQHSQLDDDTHRWIAREFGFTPFSLFEDIVDCCARGHLVTSGAHGLPADVVAAPLLTDARFTLMTGALNTLFLPSGQRKSYLWLEGHVPGRQHRHIELPAYAHVDLYVGRNAPREVFPYVLAGLAR